MGIYANFDLAGYISNVVAIRTIKGVQMSVSSVAKSPQGVRGGIPDATVNRLPMYHRSLVTLASRGVLLVSSEELADASGVNSAKLRKDLSYLGSYGTRGVGYDVEFLLYQIARALGLTQQWPVVIVGIGNLGHALAGYKGFASRGFKVVGLFDTDDSRVGEQVSVAGTEVEISSLQALPQTIRQTGASIGVIATPEASAQEVCDVLVRNGVTSILNFAPVLLEVPAGVDVRRVDLATELQILAFHEQRKSQLAMSESNVG